MDLRLQCRISTDNSQPVPVQRPPTHLIPTNWEFQPAEITSLHFDRRSITTYGFAFPDTGVNSDLTPDSPPSGEINIPSATATNTLLDFRAGDQSTKIRPPRNIIKLEDRLYYLLQPPLETIFTNRSLTFPYTPFAYQLEGVGFLYPRHAAILADEMGLGKTMQAITTIRLLATAGEVRQVLIICPKPLVTNWQREFAQWAPEIPVTIIEGNRKRREWLWNMTDPLVKLANYEIVMRDKLLLKKMESSFDLVALDEAQRIKNQSSATSRAIRSIKRHRSWALTGTPIENSSEDLCSIFDFLSPGTVRRDWKPRRLRQATEDYLLRRTKRKVLKELPPILYRDAQLSLTSEQMETYQMAEDEGVVRLAELGGEITVQHVFELILRLKQICNFDPATDRSSKFERLFVDLEELVASGEKAIVFSQWVKSLHNLKRRLSSYCPLEYHGKIATKQRDNVIQKFRDDPRHQVLLMSYGAGSVGLNLQFASYVFLFDRWWNPAVEDQAINRAHRIGAKGPVTVTRFLTQGTVEERIDEILQQKRKIFDSIFSDNETPKNAGLSQQEIFGLFDLRVPTGSTKSAA